MVTTKEAKSLIAQKLDEMGIRVERLSAHTVSFSDLARGSSVFVEVHGWKPNGRWRELEAFAHEHGFCIE